MLAILLGVVAPGHAAETARAAAETFRDCPACPEMVPVPAGTFVMGTAVAGDFASPGEADTTVIRIAQPFALGRFEVTRLEFAAFMSDSGHEVRPGCTTWSDAQGRFSDDPRRSWLDPGRPVEALETHPVNCVSWTDAQAYVRWLAQKTRRPYRLPSEAEWEYAARAGSTALRPWGDAPEAACAHANTYDLNARSQYRLGRAHAGCADGRADLAPVGQFEANAFGLYDMIGNVWEWTEDCATDSYVGRPTDGRAWTWLGGCTRRVQRGGSWVSPPSAARAAARHSGEAAERAATGGFRVALDLEEPSTRGDRR